MISQIFYLKKTQSTIINMQLLKNNFQHLLTPPGMGVHTVHTGKEIREKFHESFFKTKDIIKVQEHWKKSFPSMLKEKNNLGILGIPSDTGGGIQRGANWGPLFLRERIKYNSQITDWGDIKTIPHLLHDKYLNNETIDICRKENYQGEKLPVSPLSIAQDLSLELFQDQRKLLTLGGDHSISYPVVKSWLQAKNQQKIKTAIIHFDAHTDLMDKRLGIDICFASWAFHMLELLDRPSDLLQYGIRSSGKEKSFWTSQLGVQQYWNYDFEKIGLNQIISETIKYLKERKVEELYISYDIDCLDSKYASSTGTPEDHGLAPHETISLIRALGEEFTISGADLVEVAPFVSSYKKSMQSPEPETTLLNSGLILNQLIESMGFGI